MKLLEDRILAEGNVLSPAILKVDSFINHQVDPVLMQEMAISPTTSKIRASPKS